ncbi:MAG: Ig-like domain-containing protein, partial [Bernardetiaceae bacterium]|nr:Ig-like domain-containing protein [Bernardetiaceae bacterium]
MRQLKLNLMFTLLASLALWLGTGAMMSDGLKAQCTTAPNGTWGSHSLTAPTTTSQVTGAWGGEYSPINVTTGAVGTTFQFIVATSIDDPTPPGAHFGYVTITNNAGVPLAWGPSPIEYTFTAGGTYRFYSHDSGPPACGSSTLGRARIIRPAPIPPAPYEIISPEPGATGVSPILSSLVIDFESTPVTVGTGNLEVYKADGTLVATVPVDSASITAAGVVTFPFSTILECNEDYYVLIDNGALDDGDGFAGITDPTEWTFQTGALGSLITLIDENFAGTTGTTPPAGWTNTTTGTPGQIWRFDNPGGTAVPPEMTPPFAMLNSDFYGSGSSQNASLTTPVFDATGGGTINLQFLSQFRAFGTSSWNIEASNNGGTTWSLVASGTTTVGTTFGTISAALVGYDITSFVGGSANARVRFRYVGSWDFWWRVDNVLITRETSASYEGNLTAVVPVDNATGVEVSPTLTATYDFPIALGTGTIEIQNVGTGVAAFTLTEADVTVVGTNSIEFLLPGDLDFNTEYNVVISAGLIETCGGDAASITDLATDGLWSFTTEAAPPTGGGGGAGTPPDVDPVTNFTAIAENTSTIFLSWRASGNAERYALYRQSEVDSEWVRVGRFSVGVREFT